MSILAGVYPSYQAYSIHFHVNEAKIVTTVCSRISKGPGHQGIARENSIEEMGFEFGPEGW